MSKKKDKASLLNPKFFSTMEEIVGEEEILRAVPWGPAVDRKTGGGILEGSLVLLQTRAKAGKAQPLTSKIYTPHGPVLMGDVSVGDTLSTPDGNVAKIAKIFPQGIKDVYRITFSDNTYTECENEHLWKVAKNNKKGKYKWEILSLKEIIKRGLNLSDRPMWRVPLTEPVYFNESEQPIPAYILGCLLGDGGLTKSNTIITSADEEIINKFKEYAENNDMYLSYGGRYDYRISKKGKKNKLLNDLRNLKLSGLNSHNKFIPDIYKYGSKDQRWSLIKGLMDTDGSNNKTYAEYTSVSEKLIKDTQEVLQSLGFLARLSTRYTTCNNKKFKSYRLSISGNNINNLFSLKRKQISSIRKKTALTKTIRKIELIRQDFCQCIEIDNNEHLYLTDNFIVTHNTVSCMQFALNALNQGRHVTYVDSERRLLGKKYFNHELLEKYHQDGKLNFIRSKVNEPPLIGDEIYEQIYKMMHMPKYFGAVYIIDSFSTIVPRDTFEDNEIKATRRDTTPKLNADFLKKTSNVMRTSKSIILGVQHLMPDMNNYGALKPDGGTKFEYLSDYTLISKHSPLNWDGDPIGNSEKDSLGRLVKYQMTYNKLLSPYVNKDEPIMSYLKFGEGIWWAREALDLFEEEMGTVIKGGSWYTICMPDGTEKKVQGADRAAELIGENRAIFEPVIQKYFIEKYKITYDFTPVQAEE